MGKLEGKTGEHEAVLLLTDGEENVASARTPNEIAPLHAAQLCADLGVRVHVIAAGTGLGSTAAVWIGAQRLFEERQRLRLDRLKGS